MPNKLKIQRRRQKTSLSAVDLFCGAGGLTRGLLDAGINVVAGVDIDAACQFPYEINNGARFHAMDVSGLSGDRLINFYPKGHRKVLVGCAPCQPFSKYTQGLNPKADKKWKLLSEFSRLVKAVQPDLVSMENVPELQRHSIFFEFIEFLEMLNYVVSVFEVYCPDFGVAQNRNRLVLFASRYGKVELIKPLFSSKDYPSVREVIGELPMIGPGEVHKTDPMHRACRLSPLNLRRIKASKPGGTWRDWPLELVAKCHRKVRGMTYPGVYGRMEWDSPSPTITTQFYGFGNGRFGHPEQDRAISLREGAILQSFPNDYQFVQSGAKISFSRIGTMIGNAVPVKLGFAIGKSIVQHMNSI